MTNHEDWKSVEERERAEKGPAARRRPKAGREAYFLHVDRPAEGANAEGRRASGAGRVFGACLGSSFVVVEAIFSLDCCGDWSVTWFPTYVMRFFLMVSASRGLPSTVPATITQVPWSRASSCGSTA